jgi:hypothetical protein
LKHSAIGDPGDIAFTCDRSPGFSAAGEPQAVAVATLYTCTWSPSGGTRASPVVVVAGDYQEAFRKAQVDETIVTLGKDISAVRLSEAALELILASGARDLRRAEKADSQPALGH